MNKVDKYLRRIMIEGWIALWGGGDVMGNYLVNARKRTQGEGKEGRKQSESRDMRK